MDLRRPHTEKKNPRMQQNRIIARRNILKKGL